MMRGTIFSSRIARTALLASLVMLASALISAASADAESPRWVLTAVPSPTNIKPSSPRNEVQDVTITATGGTFELEVLPAGFYSEFEKTTALAYDASAAEVQAALNALEGVSVTVTGGPGSARPYEVTFEGADSEVKIESLRADSSGLTGGTATVSEVTKGATAAQITVTAVNVSNVFTDGTAITLSDALPSWLKATSVTGYDTYGSGIAVTGNGSASMSCSTAPISCSYEKPVDPGDQLVMVITLAAGATSPSGSLNRAEVSGGGAAPVQAERELAADEAPAAFGPAPGGVFAALSTTQAGAHPNLTTFFELSSLERDNGAGDPKDIRFDLPPGLVGSTVGMPKCSMSRVISAATRDEKVCPDDTMVGFADVSATTRAPHGERLTFMAPVYDIEPAPGEPAAFGFDVLVLPVRLDTSVLSNGSYGVRVTAPDLPESLETLGSSVTIWGVPSEHSGPGGNGEKTFVPPGTYGGVDPGQSPVPLLTNPQQCTEPLVASVSADAWAKPGVFSSEEALMGTPTGCALVPFDSSFTFLPDTLEAGAPAGYAFNLNIPQSNKQNTLATSSLKNFTLKLPLGVVVNPSAAWGLKACSKTQFYGSKYPSQEPAAPAECPREAQVGEVEVETPDLEKTLKGQVFLAEPECNPCTPADAEGGKMVRLYVQLVGEGEAGIIVKLEGQGHVDQATGQITTVFDNNPQVPFDKMHFVLGGGPRAVLANPRTCGTVTANGDLMPWSTGPGVSDSLPFYELEINQGCFGPQFKPSFVAGMTNIQAGEYGPFTLSFGRSDHDQFLGGLSMQTPPGFLGKLSGVELCKEPQASTGTCGPNSLIGHVQALTGPGADPFLVSGGQVFLTEGYGGGNYGLSIVVPAVAGPYTLSGTTGHGTVVVRAKIVVDPHTAALTVTSDPLPTMLDGIPLQLKAVNVTIDRPDFTFNPTSCAKTSIVGTLSSAEGMSATAATPFQVTNCATLGFKPQFAVSVSGKTSRADGAGLDVKLTFPAGSQGKETNIQSVKVDLPKQLPSRLTTLQKACPDTTFNANPAACAPESRVGQVTAVTPILPEPLRGPAYFVSHGGQKFPELIFVLQGYGVTIHIDGETFISKTGITSDTLRAVPDAPLSSFELSFPAGPYSALAANGNLCRDKLAMPTAFTAQNGAVLHQSTPIVVTGCKPTISVVGHKVRGAHATISVGVPSAGTLVASGNGLSPSRVRVGAAGTVTIRLALSKRQRLLLARHPGRKLKSTVKLSFTPAHGPRITSSVAVLMG
jgi:hypothetical protein